MSASEPKSSKASDANSDLVPVSIDRKGETEILITWSDESVTNWSVSGLRKACPCATCREKKRGEEKQETEGRSPQMLPVLSAAEAQPLRIESMRPVGSYAYNISFSDGHSSGIYPFAMLHDLPSD